MYNNSTMPTLQQLNIDTETQEKLSTGGGGGIKRKHHPSSSSTAAASNNNEEVKLSPHNTKKKHWSPPKPKFSNSTTTKSQQHYAPIKTPSALLSRNPIQLSTSLQTSLSTIKSIRNNAAIEIINNDYIGHGKQCEEIINCVSRYCIANNDDINDQRLNSCPTALLAGAVTALDLCARELLLKNISKSRTLHSHSHTAANNMGLSRGQDCISTGSKSIDQLLAPDSSYTSFHDGWTISYPYKIPSNNYENEQQTMNKTSPHHPSSSSSSHGGVPFGMVTELSGPPSSGKTQLALSIAAHAVLDNEMDVHYISGGNSTKAISRRLFSIFLELARSSVVAVQYQQQHNGSGSGEGMTYEMEEEAKSIALKALDRVHVASVPDAYSLLAMLARVDNEEKSSCSGSSNGKGRKDYGEGRKEEDGGTLLVVDSISGCLGHHLSSEGGAALANQVALTLRQMARTHDSYIMDDSGVDTSPGTTLSARRFAVVVTNGSVAKYSLDNKEQSVGSSSSTKATTSTASEVNQTQNKPAMGRYWHVSDVGIWLEEDTSTQYQQHQQPINFYDDTSVVGLALSEKKIVRATLQNHYGKSCRRIGENNGGQTMNDKPIAKFRIRSGGIDDLES